MTGFQLDQAAMKRLCLLAVGLIPILLAVNVAGAADDASVPSTKPIRVAVFQDAGVSEKVAGLIELLNTYSDLQVTKLDGNDIRGGKLAAFDVVLVPGGSGSKEAAALEESGRNEIRSFVERG